jgi:hypothetical protein
MCSDVLDGCNEIECGALPRLDENGKPRRHYYRWFVFGETPCRHVLAKHKETCAIRDGVRCDCFDDE